MINFQMSAEKSCLLGSACLSYPKKEKGKNMKKLLIAAALTASVCSFGADAVAPLNAQTFDGEGYTLATDDYIAKVDGDASAVTTYGGDNLAASDKTTEAGAAGANYLNLSTEGSTLWRKINTDGSEYNAAATGTYIDTLVQFTATEEAPTTFEADAKLAMWLQATDNGDGTATTNLYVRGASIAAPTDDTSSMVATPVNIALSATVEASTWYRLTVKAVPVVDYTDSGIAFTAFAIYLDGVLVAPAATQISAEWIAFMKDASVPFTVSEEVLPSLIPSITAGVEGDQNLYGVGFKGTGAIDSIAWTDEDIYPFSVPGAAFTLTITKNEGIGAVQYAIGEAEAVTYTTPVEVKEGDVVTITATAVNDWWIAPTIDPITVDGDEEVAVNATAVTASDVNVTVPSGSTVTADTVFNWAKAIDGATPASIRNAANIFNNYLLNVTDLTVDPQIKIVSIDVTKSPVEVVAKVTDANGTEFNKILDAKDIKGALKYKAAATLELLKTAESKAAIEAGDQFIKVVVE